MITLFCLQKRPLASSNIPKPSRLPVRSASRKRTAAEAQLSAGEEIQVRDFPATMYFVYKVKVVVLSSSICNSVCEDTDCNALQILIAKVCREIYHWVFLCMYM